MWELRLLKLKSYIFVQMWLRLYKFYVTSWTNWCLESMLNYSVTGKSGCIPTEYAWCSNMTFHYTRTFMFQTPAGGSAWWCAAKPWRHYIFSLRSGALLCCWRISHISSSCTRKPVFSFCTILFLIHYTYVILKNVLYRYHLQLNCFPTL